MIIQLDILIDRQGAEARLRANETAEREFRGEDGGEI
jgi:hypothetical protein